jgi:glycerol-3-phosphate dehydrogenase (NAD(P)+)
MEIAVLGAGAFGTALTKMFSEVPGKPHAVTLWCRSAEAARHIEVQRESSHLPGVRLGASVTVTHDLAAAVAGKPLVVGVTPSHVVREVFAAAAGDVAPDAVVVLASKGIEQSSLMTMDQVLGDVLPARIAQRAAFLSGPTFARELVRGLPAAIVVASHDAAAAARVQAELSTTLLRMYTTDDVKGVELGGALKNVFAIGAGIADGMGFGHNTRAALITRGLNEMARLGLSLGANPLTFAGLAGVGDLVLTCTGDLSRNRHVGLELGRGKSLADILGAMTEVAEGVRTTKAAHDLAARHGVEMPIVDAIYNVIERGLTAAEAVSKLLEREVGHERL